MQALKQLLIGFIIAMIGMSVGVYIWLLPPNAAKCVAFTNGTILTMEDETPQVDALLVQGSRIIAHGDRTEILNQARDCEIYNLNGRTLMPGLIEPHTHPIATALLGQAIDVSGFSYNSRAEVIGALRRGIAQDEQGPILAFGWDPVLVEDLTPPTLAELDALSPDRPLMILTQMMHDAYANSAALAAAGIHKNTPNPEGGEFLRDENGNLTGAIREVSAINVLMEAIPKAPIAAMELLLNIQYAKYAKAGFTTIGALGPRANVGDSLRYMYDLADEGNPILQTVVYALPSQLEASGWKVGTTTPNRAFILRGIKLWMDGSPFTGGAALAEPYEDTPLTRDRMQLHAPHFGTMNYDIDAFTEEFRRFHAKGYQIAVHVQGEKSIDRVLDVAEKVLAELPRADHRHRLEHNALLTKAQIVRAKELGVTLSFFIDHIYFYGHRLPELLGQERTNRYLALGEAVKAGHRITFHSDSPATPLNPFLALYTAVTRQPAKGGPPINMENALTRMEGLKAMTINAAWQLRLEGEKGTLTPGKLADLVILSADPSSVPAEELLKIRVYETWIDGRRTETRPTTIKNAKLIFELFKNKLF